MLSGTVGKKEEPADKNLVTVHRFRVCRVNKRARAFETIVVFPHPYSATFTGIQNTYFPEDRLERLFKMVDGIEVINAENLNKWNLRSALLGFNLDKGITGGSDGHRLPQMGRAVCYASCKKDRRFFLDTIKGRQTLVVGKEIDIIRKVRSNGVKLRTNIRNYPDLVEKNLRYSCTVINSKSKAFKDNMKRSFSGRFKDKHKMPKIEVRLSPSSLPAPPPARRPEPYGSESRAYRRY